MLYSWFERLPRVNPNLRMDPFERAEHANAMGYQRWYMDRMFVIAPAGGYVGQLLKVQGVSAATKARQL